jgi:hypothetical protein
VTRFFVGLHRISATWRFRRCLVSVNSIKARKSDFRVKEWMMDSGGFTEILNHGDHRLDVEEYARQVVRWARCGELLAAASQDYPCGPKLLDRTGLTVSECQSRTLERFRRLRALVPRRINLMPVLQGQLPAEYVRHLHAYGDLLQPNAWVGVGNVVSRKSAEEVAVILRAIKEARPDLRLHGFGIKLALLRSPRVRNLLWSADSIAWSYAARKNGRDANSWLEAFDYFGRIQQALKGQRVSGPRYAPKPAPTVLSMILNG